MGLIPIRSWALVSFVAFALAEQAGAQTIRGTVVDGQGRPVAGAVLQLLDTASAVSARTLSTERGEFRLAAPRAGTYRVRSLRIGFTPWISSNYALAAGATLTERIALANVSFALDTVRIAARNSCKLAGDSGAATFAVFQQARTALLAAELTRAAHNIASTTLIHDRTLDAEGRRTLKQKTAVHSEVVREPWLTIPPGALHAKGYVLQDDNFGMTYYAPGIDMLVSDYFVADHCFQLKSEKDRIGIVFEPTRERGDTAEIRGTLWLDRATSALQSMTFKYTNLPRDFDSDAGGLMEFSRLRNGAWAISRWDIRMGVFERRTRPRGFGGSDIHLAEMETQGGELILALLGPDTLFAQKPRILRGVVRDSTSGSPAAGARVSVSGTSLSTTADQRGHFDVPGLLPGVYTLEVHTASLDSVSAMHRADVEFINDDIEKDIRILTGAEIIASVCRPGTTSFTEPGVLLGRVRVSGGESVPTDTRVSVGWSMLTAERGVSPGAGDRIAPVKHSREVRVAPDGVFRVCGVAADHDLSIEAESDSGIAASVTTKIPAFGRFAHADLTLMRSAAAASFAGHVMLAEGGTPVPDVEVVVGDSGRAVKTDSGGAFRLLAIPSGLQRLRIRKLGYSGLDTTIVFGAGAVIRRDIRISKVVQLTENVTKANALPRTFDENRKLGLGSFFDRAQLEKLTGRQMRSVLAEVRSLHLVLGVGNSAYITSNRRRQCPPGMLARMCGPDYVSMGPEIRCASRVFLDGILQNRGNPPEAVNVRDYDVTQLEAIEWYASAAETPLEYTGLNDNCGVLAMWSRRTISSSPP